MYTIDKRYLTMCYEAVVVHLQAGETVTVITDGSVSSEIIPIGQVDQARLDEIEAQNHRMGFNSRWTLTHARFFDGNKPVGVIRRKRHLPRAARRQIQSEYQAIQQQDENGSSALYDRFLKDPIGAMTGALMLFHEPPVLRFKADLIGVYIGEN